MRVLTPWSALSTTLTLALALGAAPGCGDESLKELPRGEEGEGEEGEGEGGGEGEGEGEGEGANAEGEGEPGEGEGETNLCLAVDCPLGACDALTGECADRIPCRADVDCLNGRTCQDDGDCSDLCAGVECTRGICDSITGECAQPEVCEADADCLDEDAVCDVIDIDGTQVAQCVEPCVARFVADALELEDDEELPRTCLDELFCDDSGHCVDDPNTCGEDVDCPGTRVCLNDDSCATNCNEVGCNAGRCFDDGHCRQPEKCRGANECLDGLICIDGACVDPEQDPRDSCDRADCPGNQVCNNFGDCDDAPVCEVNDDCRLGFCDEDSGDCLACRFDEHCPGSQRCFFGLFCGEPDVCANDDDCRGGRVCADGACTGGDCEPDEFDADAANDMPGDATVLGDGIFSGLSICEGEEDWYAVAVGVGQGLRASIRFDHNEADLDLALFAGDDPDTPLALSAGGPVDLEEVVLGQAEEDTVVLLQIAGFGGNVSATYDLAIELVDGFACEDDLFDEIGAGNTQDTALLFNVGAIVEGSICAGDEDWFVTTLDNDETLVADLFFDPAFGALNVEIRDSSGAANDAGRQTEDGATAQWTAEVGGPYWVRVVGLDGEAINDYDLSLSKFEQPGLDECEAAAVVEQGLAVIASTADEDAGADHIASCVYSLDGPDHVYQFSVDKPSVVTLQLTSDDFDASLSVRADCDAVGTEVGCASDCAVEDGQLACVDGPARLSVLLDPGTYFIFVDAALDGAGEYELIWWEEDPICIPGDRSCLGNIVAICADDGSGWLPIAFCDDLCDESGVCVIANDTCDTPTELEDGVAVEGSTLGVGDNYDTGCSDQNVASGDAVYSFTVDERVAVAATLWSDEADLSVAVRNNCRAPGSELGCGFATDGDDAALVGVLDAGTYYAIVDGLGVEGDFELQVDTFPLNCEPDAVRCNPDDETLQQTCVFDVNADPAVDWQDSVECEHGCRAGHCIVDNDNCDEPPPLLIPDTLVSGNTTGTVDDASPTCDELSRAGEVFYRFAIEERSGVRLELRNFDFLPVLHVRTECDAQGSEVACQPVQAFNTPFGVQVFGNAFAGPMDPGTYYVAVDGRGDPNFASEGRFSLYFDTYELACDPGAPAQCDGDFLLACSDDGSQIVDVLCANGCNEEDGHCNVENDTCEGPIELTVDEVMEGQLLGAGDDYRGADCPFGGGIGPDLVYEFTIDGEQVVTLSLDGDGSDFILYVRQQVCDSPISEVVCEDDTLFDEETRRIREQIRQTLDAGTYYVFVDTYNGLRRGNLGSFELLLETADILCEPGAERCSLDGRRVQICADGLEWVTSELCEAGCEDGECVQELGGTCEEPRPIEPGEVYEGDTFDFEANHGAGCAPTDGAPEVVYTFELEDLSRVQLSLEGSRYDTAIYVRTECGEGNSEVTCNDDAFGLQSFVDFFAEPGVRYFVFVDGFANGAGAYTLSFDAEAIECLSGELRCGGDTLQQCDDVGGAWEDRIECAGGCVDGECIIENETCDDDTPAINVGESVRGTTRGAIDDYSGTCAVGFAGDVAYQFTLRERLGVQVGLSADFDGHFYIRSDCDDRGTESACAEPANGPSSWSGVLDAGNYFIIVDGVGFDRAAAEGEFELSINIFNPVCAPGVSECRGSLLRTCRDDGTDWDAFQCPGRCIEDGEAPAACDIGNNTCENPENLEPGRWYNGDTRAAEDNESGLCAGDGRFEGGDVVYSFSVPEDFGAFVRFEWEEGELPPLIYVRTVCDRPITEVDGICGLPWDGRGPVDFRFPLDPGDYFLFVDNTPEGGLEDGEFAFLFDLYELGCAPGDAVCDDDANVLLVCEPGGTEFVEVDCGEEGVCDADAGRCIFPGETCDDAIEVELEFDEEGRASAELEGSTADMENDYEASCSAFDFGSGDAVYHFQLPADGSVQVELVGDLFPVVSLRELDCEDDFGEIACGNELLDGAAAFEVEGLQAGTDYYVFVDGFFGVSGPYFLTINVELEQQPECEPGEQRCDELGEATELCDDDGFWAPGDFCQAGCVDGECFVEPGGTCDEPWAAEAGGIYVGSTVGHLSDHGAGCSATLGAPEVIYSYTGGEQALVTASLEGSDYDTALYVRANCGDAGSEVTCNDDWFGLQSQVEFFAEAGVTYYIFVDGFGASAGDYQLAVDAQPVGCWPPGQRECDGDIPRICDPDSLEWTIGEACDAGCFNGSCIPLNDACDAPAALEDGVPYLGDTGAASNDNAGACAFGNAGDTAHSFTVEEGREGVEVSFDARFSAYYYIRGDCADIDTELACEVDGFGINYWRLPAGEYFIVVDGHGNLPEDRIGNYELTVRTFPSVCAPGATMCQGSLLKSCLEDGSDWDLGFECPGDCADEGDAAAYCVYENDDCDGVIDLPDGRWISGDTRGARDDDHGTCGDMPGGDVVYRLHVPDDQPYGIDLAFEWPDGQTPPVIYLRQGSCERRVREVDGLCGIPRDEFGDPLTLHGTMEAGDYYLWIDADPPLGFVEGEFALRAERYPVVCETPGEWHCREDNIHALCSDDGAEWIEELDCNTDEGLGVCDLAYDGCLDCAPGDSWCAGDSDVLVTCDESGFDVFEEACGPGSCDDEQGACVCDPGAWCDDETNIYHVCADDGLTLVSQACGGGGCDPDEGGCFCDPRTTWCDELSNTFNACADDGVTIDVEECFDGICTDDGGCSFCPPGLRECDEDGNLVWCAEDGSQSFVEACGDLGLCIDPELGCDLPEGDTCDNAFEVGELELVDGTVEVEIEGDTSGLAANHEGLCGFDSGAPEAVYHFTAPADLLGTFAVVEPDYDSTVYLRAGDCTDLFSEVACNDDDDAEPLGSTVEGVPLEAGQDYYIFVDGFSDDSGSFTLRITLSEPECEPGEARCSDDGTTLEECSGIGLWEELEDCPAGCDPNAVACGDVCELSNEVGPGPIEGSIDENTLDLVPSSCGDSAWGDHIFTVTIDEPSQASILGQVTDGFAVVDLYRGPCGSGDLIGCGEVGDLLGGVLEPGDYHFVVTGTFDEGGGYSLELAIDPLECYPGDARLCDDDTPLTCNDETFEWDRGEACLAGCIDGICAPENGDCEGPDVPELESGDVYEGDTTVGTNDFSGSCAFGNAPDTVHRFTVDAESDGVRIDMVAEFNAFYYFRDVCEDEDSESVCATPVALGGEAVRPPIAEPFFAEDPVESCGDAEVQLIDLAGGPERIGFFSGNTEGATDEVIPGCDQWLVFVGTHTSGDVVWALEVEEPVEMAVDVTADYNVMLSLREGSCDDESEVACTDNGIFVAPLAPVQLQPGVTYYLVADGIADGVGNVDLEILFTSLGEVPERRFFRLPEGEHFLIVDGWGEDPNRRRGSYRLGFEQYDAVCEPGTMRCDGDTLITCAIDGSEELSEECGVACDAEVGSCIFAENNECIDAIWDELWPVEGDTRTGTDTFADDPEFGSGTGPDLWYGFSVEECSLVTVTVTPLDGAYDAAYCLFAECPDDGGDPLLCQDIEIEGFAESDTYLVEGGAFLVAVDGWGGTSGPFEINVAMEPGGPENCPEPEELPTEPGESADTCEDADEAAWLADLSEGFWEFELEGSTADFVDDYKGTCWASGGAADVVWAFEVSDFSTASFSMRAEYDTALHLRADGCDDEAQIACNDDGDTGIGSSDIDGVELEPGVRYYLVADGWGDEAGDFTLLVEINPGE